MSELYDIVWEERQLGRMAPFYKLIDFRDDRCGVFAEYGYSLVHSKYRYIFLTPDYSSYDHLVAP